jgi:hypothetical protein
MITAQQADTRPDEVARVPGRRPRLFSSAREALRGRLEKSQSAFLIQATLAAGPSADALLGDAAVAAFAGAFVGCLTTECFSASGIAPGIASAFATALLCGSLLVTGTTCLFAGEFFSALYGGTFAGMTPIAWLGDSPFGHSAVSTGALSVALSILCGLVFSAVAKLDTRSAAPIGIGCGGRLGAIAAVASFLFIELIGLLGADANRFHSVAAGAFDVEPGSAIRGFLACLVGIFGTLLVLRQRRTAGGSAAARIFLASAAALLGLMILHVDNPDDARTMDAFYAGCFLGMSTLDRLKGWFQPVFGALVLIVLLVPVRGFLHGFGGGLGLAAFVTVMVLVALSGATARTTRDMLTRRNLGTAIAGAVIAVFLVIGLITADPVAEEVPISVATTPLEPIAELSGATSVRLVVGTAAPSLVDNPIPLGVSLVNAADDVVVVLSGLPSGAKMTNGRPSAAGDWYLLARELANAAILPAPGFVGGADAMVELRRADHAIVDRQTLHLEWTGPAPRATTDVEQLPTGQLPDAVTADHEAIFREFLQSRRHAALEIRRTAHLTRTPAGRTAAHDQRVGGLAATLTGLKRLALPLGSGVVHPLRVRARRGGDGQEATRAKSSLP